MGRPSWSTAATPSALDFILTMAQAQGFLHNITSMFHTVDPPLVLASGSPRRRGLLEDLGICLQVDVPEVDERMLPGESPRHYVKRLAEAKADVVAARHGDAWVLAADTAVASAGLVLGKPRDQEDALEMLGHLCGKWHEVWTGFCLLNHALESRQGDAVRTEVLFSEAAKELRQAYVQTGEPMDKAGAYGIQGIGGVLVQSIRGSYTNVVGLPLAEVCSALLRQGVIVPR